MLGIGRKDFGKRDRREKKFKKTSSSPFRDLCVAFGFPRNRHRLFDLASALEFRLLFLEGLRVGNGVSRRINLNLARKRTKRIFPGRSCVREKRASCELSISISLAAATPK